MDNGTNGGREIDEIDQLLNSLSNTSLNIKLINIYGIFILTLNRII